MSARSLSCPFDSRNEGVLAEFHQVGRHKATGHLAQVIAVDHFQVVPMISGQRGELWKRGGEQAEKQVPTLLSFRKGDEDLLVKEPPQLLG